jgi:hypothetical protein
VAQAGISTTQVANITDTWLAPGTYFAAVAMDNGTGQIIRNNTPSTLALQVCGVQNQASAFPLPSSATFANPINSAVPFLAITSKAVL